MEIDVLSLKKDLDSGEVVLIDVREPYELDICSIKHSIHIPMNNIPYSLDSLDRQKRYAIICHSGIRSQSVTNYLASLNFKVKNVIGGIDQWAIKVDKGMKRY